MAAGNNSDQRLVCRQIEIQNILRLPAAFNPATNAMLTTSTDRRALKIGMPDDRSWRPPHFRGRIPTWAPPIAAE